MRKVSQNEFDLLQKRKGVTVKRKMGAQKKPESVVEDRKVLSGTRQPEKPVPALPAVSTPKPMASMTASMAARDAQLKLVIENNTKVIREFKTQLATQVAAKPVRVSWRHKVKRTEKLLIDEVISTPMEK